MHGRRRWSGREPKSGPCSTEPTTGCSWCTGQHGLAGVVLESFLLEGRQEPGDPARLVYGRSVTDACMDIGTTAKALAALSDPVRCRRG